MSQENQFQQDDSTFKKCDQLEEMELDRNCHEISYTRCTSLLNLLMEISSLHLVSQKRIIHGQHLDPRSVQNVIKPFSLTIPQTRSHLLRLLRSILIAYLTIKFLLASYLLLEHDRMRHFLKPLVRSNATQRGYCALKKDIYFADSLNKADYDYMVAITGWLNFLGVTLHGLAGVGTVTTGILTATPLVFYCLALVCTYFRPLRLDHLSFLLDPLSERRRVKRELEKIVVEIFNSLTNRHRASVECYGESQRSINIDESYSKSKTLLANRRSENLKYAKILSNMINMNRVQPANLSSSWHKTILYFAHLLTVASLLTSFLAASGSTNTLVVIELLNNEKSRLRREDCKSWHPDGKFIEDSIEIGMINRDSLVGNSLMDGNSLKDLSDLNLSAGRNNLMNFQTFLYVIECNILIGLLSMWSSFYFNLYIIGSLHFLCWLKQIFRQIRDVSEQLHRQTLVEVDPDCRLEEEELVNRLLASYLNFELFRRQHRNFHEATKLLIGQFASLFACSFILCYVVATQVETNFTLPILYSSAAVLIVTDINIALSSYKSKYVEHTMREIIQLVSKCSSSPLRLAYPVELWRRQLLTDTQTRDLFAPNLLGFSISYEKLVSLNAFMGAIWLLFLRLL